MSRRLLLAVPLGALGALVLAGTAYAEYRGTSIWENIAPQSKLGADAFADRYPLTAFRLDYKVDTSLSNTSGYIASMAQWIASLLWTATTWLLRLAMDVFAWSYSLDLLNGDGGVFAPLSTAVRSMQNTVFGQFAIAAVSLMGLWLLWVAIGKREYERAFTRVLILLALGGLAWAIIYKPKDTVGWASQQVNAVSLSFLGGMNSGNAEEAKRDVGDTLFRVFVYEPWKVLEFGGRHCVSTTRVDDEGFPVPVSPRSDQPKRCMEAEPYARAYLAANSQKARDAVYFRIKNGEAPWDKADALAVDPQQEGGAFDRLGAALLIFLGSLGAAILLLWLSFAVVLAQVLALFWMCFAPAALLAAWIPGGERFAHWWATKLGVALIMKVALSLVLSVVVTVSAAMAAAAGSLGFLLAFGIQCAFWWAILLGRKRIMATAGFQDTKAGHAVSKPVQTVMATSGAGEMVSRWRDRREEREFDHHHEHARLEDHDTETEHTRTERTERQESSTTTTVPVHSEVEQPVPASQNGHRRNGQVPHPSEQEVEVPGHRVPPRPVKQHIHSNGHVQQPEPQVVYDTERDTSHLPKVPVTVQQHPEVEDAPVDPPPVPAPQS